MNKPIDPKTYGLPPGTILMQRGPEEFVLIIKRKSRIIMKDAEAILEKAGKVIKKVPNAIVNLETTAPVCSKSTQYLSENDVAVFKLKTVIF